VQQALRGPDDLHQTTGSVVIPLGMSSTYRHDAPGEIRDDKYGHTGNLTRTALDDLLASLEEANWALCCGNGTGAPRNLTLLLNRSDEILSSDDIYPGPYRLLAVTLARYGIDTTLVDFNDLDATEDRCSSPKPDSSGWRRPPIRI